MELKIVTQKDNLLLHRKEIHAHISFDKATPSNADVAKHLATKLSAHEDVIVMKHIHGGFGKNVAHVEAYIYDSKEQKMKIEPKIKVKAVAGAAPAAQ